MNQAFAESEKTVAASEALIQHAENLCEQGDKLFKSLGIPRGSARQVISHPLASDELKVLGRGQIEYWRKEVAEIMKSGNRSVMVKRKKSPRNLLAI